MINRKEELQAMIKGSGFDPVYFAAIMERHIFHCVDYFIFEQTLEDIEMLLEIAEEQERNDQKA